MILNVNLHLTRYKALHRLITNSTSPSLNVGPIGNLTPADEYVQSQENSNHSILYKPVAYAEELGGELMFEHHFPVNRLLQLISILRLNYKKCHTCCLYSSASIRLKRQCNGFFILDKYRFAIWRRWAVSWSKYFSFTSNIAACISSKRLFTPLAPDFYIFHANHNFLRLSTYSPIQHHWLLQLQHRLMPPKFFPG